MVRGLHVAVKPEDRPSTTRRRYSCAVYLPGNFSLRRPLRLPGLLLLAADGNAEDAKSFYAGKTLKIIVGLPPGGGADAYARIVQRHLGRHIPGSPSIVTQNMPGAGSLRSVMALASSPEDGTVMAHFSSGLLTEAITAPEKGKVDFRDFAWIGNVSEDVRVCYVRSALGARTWPELMAARSGHLRCHRAGQCRQCRHRHDAQSVRPEG